MIDQKQIELRIKASLTGGRDLKAITQSIGELTENLDKQAIAARKGEGAYDELKAAVGALAIAQQELTGRRGLVKSLDTQTEAIKKQEAAVESARERLDKYAETLGDDRTAQQQKKLQALTKAFNESQVAVEFARDQYARLSKALRESGVDTDNTADEIERLDKVILETADSFKRGNGELRDYSVNVNKARAATKALVDEQAKLRKLQDGNEADAALGRQQIAAAAAAAVQRKEDDARKSGLNALRQSIEQRNQSQAAIAAEEKALQALAAAIKKEADARDEADRALRRSADAAEAATRSYNSLARASTNLKAPVKSIRDAVNEIIDPAKEARRTLAGVEEQVATLAAEIAAGKGKVTDYRATLEALSASQRALSAQASLVATFAKQTAALREARTAFVEARAEVANYAAQLRAGGASAEQFVSKLAESEVKVKKASAALKEQILVTRDTKTALREAGIGTTQLAEAQKRLTETAKQATTAVQALDKATPADPGRGFRLFGDEGRTTLSLVQRIRGEILALGAAYVGLQGVVSLAAGSLKAFTQAQGLENTLSFALGGTPQQTAQEIQYLREQADRLGVSFEEASKGYAKFATAAVKSGAPIKEARFIFESFAEVGRVINLTPTELNGLFNAVGQSFSKGKIQAEELRQQIGERLPGAFAFAQQALRDKFPDLDKALEKGLVGAENMLIIAESIRMAAENQLSPAIKSLDAEQQRFNNSVLFFKKQIADAGFASAYTELLKELTEFFKSDDGKAFAEGIAGAFTTLVNVLREALKFTREYATELKFIAALLAGLVATKLFFSIGAGAIAFANALKTATVATGALGVAMKLLQRATVVLALAVAAFDIAAYFIEKFGGAEVAAIKFGGFLEGLWLEIVANFRLAFEDFPGFIANVFKAALNLVTSFSSKFYDALAFGAKALGFTDLEKSLRKASESVNSMLLNTETSFTDRGRQIRAQLKKDLAAIRSATDSKAGEVLLRGMQPRDFGNDNAGLATSSPGARTGNVKDSAAETKKRQTEIEALDKMLTALEARTNKIQTDTLSNQLKAVDLQYKDLRDRIGKLGGKEQADLQARFDRDSAKLKLEITTEFNDKLLAEQTALLAKIEAAEAAAGRKQKNDLGAQLKAVSDQYEATYREIDETIAKRQANGLDTTAAEEAKRRLDGAVLEIAAATQLKFIKDDLALREKEINDLLAIRKETIDQIREKEANNEINSQQAIDQINAVIASSQPAVDKLAAGGRSVAESLRGVVEDTTLDAFISKLDTAANSGARLSTQIDVAAKIIRDGLNNGIDAGLDATLQALEDVAQGTKSVSDAFKSLGRTVLGTIGDVIKQLIKAAIQAAILRAIAGGATGTVGNNPSAYIAPSKHQGGRVGSPGTRRRVDPSWFANAPRHHNGTIVGLASNEYPTILKRNEEVLKDSDPRNILNGGAAAGGGNGGGQRIVLVDDRQRVPEAMAGAEGGSVIVQQIKANLPTIRQMLK